MKKNIITDSEASPGPVESKIWIAGIGASAGGVEALSAFFSNVKPDSGIAYVVILHLSPDYDSKLSEVIRERVSMPVMQVTEKVLVKKNTVYVVPPNRHLEMVDGHICVSDNILVEERRAPVDIFFRTLSETHGRHAIGVILSGTGANGSMGIKRIKENGGAVYVQNPQQAPFNEMPRNSIATELVDEILDVELIPQKILDYTLNPVSLPAEPENDTTEEDNAKSLRNILTRLRTITGHDFSNYKRATLMRRIERRLNVKGLVSLSAYANYIRNEPAEAHALLKDLLISVTNFFRDKSPFNALEKEIIPVILEGKTGEDIVRIWVAGCATGEEAYSIAMLCAEHIADRPNTPKIQIFATDIDDTALAIARAGLYTINDAADVSPERLQRFFHKDGDIYKIRRELREMVLFAHHNVLKDPPFSTLELISCRNLLIYLNPSGQNRVMNTFHFALKPGCYLFLGSSETVDSVGDLFAVSNRENHLYQSRAARTSQYQIPEGSPQLKVAGHARTTQDAGEKNKLNTQLSYADLHRNLLEEYAPPSVVVNEDYDIIHLSDNAGKYLRMTGGEASKNLLKLIRPELRLELRTAFYRAAQEKVNVETEALPVQTEDKQELVKIHIRPVLRPDDTARGFMLVLFEPDDSGAVVSDRVLMSEKPIVNHLEEELIQARTQLRSSNEQHDVQAEELKASNEELQAMNEELRSAAEELETGKEELQSINEELITVNQELKVKIEETTLSNNNFRNLINSTDIATIFLDRNFRVNMFTPASLEIFNLIPADFGRQITDITNKLEYPELLQDIESVIQKLKSVTREVKTSKGRIFLLRILPYRTTEDRINGVVLTFLDITERIRSDEALRKSEERFRAFVLGSSDAIFAMNSDWSEMYNLSGSSLLEETDIPTRTWLQKYIPPEEQSKVQASIQKAVNNKKIFELEHAIIRADGSKGWIVSHAVPFMNPQGLIVEWFGAARDVTERKKFESNLRASEEKYRLLDKQKDDFIDIASHELKTPVTSIKAYSELLLERFRKANDSNDAELMVKLNAQVDKLTHLITNLLDTTKLNEGKLVFTPERFDLNKLLIEQPDTLQHLTDKHQITFVPDGEVLVLADKERISQVVVNFVSNAIKYSPGGGEIKISLEKGTNSVMVSVKDSGIGIAPELINKVFDRFFRITGPGMQTYPGMGLGLYICMQIIERHGGTINAESTLGKGSVFSFTIPYETVLV